MCVCVCVCVCACVRVHVYVDIQNLDNQNLLIISHYPIFMSFIFMFVAIALHLLAISAFIPK